MVEDELDSLTAQVEYAKELLDKMIAGAPDDAETTTLESRCDAVAKKHAELTDRVHDDLQDAEAASDNVHRFASNLRTHSTDLADLEDNLDHLGAVGRDPDTIESQMDDATKCLTRIDGLERNVDDLRSECDDLIANGFISENDPYKQQVENLGKQAGRLRERVKQRQEELEKTLEEVKQVCLDAEQLGITIEQLEDDLSQEKPIAADINIITQQQKDMKVPETFCTLTSYMILLFCVL